MPSISRFRVERVDGTEGDVGDHERRRDGDAVDGGHGQVQVQAVLVVGRDGAAQVRADLVAPFRDIGESGGRAATAASRIASMASLVPERNGIRAQPGGHTSR